jgi:hypothetical protein
MTRSAVDCSGDIVDIGAGVGNYNTVLSVVCNHLIFANYKKA